MGWVIFSGIGPCRGKHGAAPAIVRLAASNADANGIQMGVADEPDKIGIDIDRDCAMTLLKEMSMAGVDVACVAQNDL